LDVGEHGDSQGLDDNEDRAEGVGSRQWHQPAWKLPVDNWN
jgi:hypothetical protein